MFAHKGLLTLALIAIPGMFMSAERPLSAQQEPKQATTPQSTKTAPPSDRLQAVRAEIQKAKASLVKEGKYRCCVSPSCDWCLLTDEDSACECMANLKAGKEVCPGCGLGWHNGQGIAKGIEKSRVKWNISHEHKH